MRGSAKADFTRDLDASLSKLREDLISRFCSLVSDLQADNEELRRRLEEAERRPSAPPSTDEEQDQEDDHVEAEPERAPRPPTPPRAAIGQHDRRNDSRARSPQRSRSPLERRQPVAPPAHSLSRSRSPLERRQPGGARSLSRNRDPKGSGKGKDGGTLCFLYLLGKCHRNQCADRHPAREEAKALLDKMQKTTCKWGMECKRRDCVFRHPADRGF